MYNKCLLEIRWISYWYKHLLYISAYTRLDGNYIFIFLLDFADQYIVTMEINGDDQLSVVGNTKSTTDAEKREGQYLYWSFTWNDYTMETMEITFNILKHECAWYVIQEEVAPTTGREHLQGCVYLKKKRRHTEVFRWNKDIHWSVTVAITASAYYCSREDKRHGKLWTHNFDIPEKIINNFRPHGWQLDVLNIIDKPCAEDDRIINWFWEPNGGVGKSQLALWLYDYKDALVCMGKATDIFHIMNKEKNRRKIFVFDITKERMENFQYTTIEQIKNGYVMSGKYDGNCIRFNRPHIIIFANEPPNTYKMTSNGRWNIVEIKTSQQQYDLPELNNTSNVNDSQT